MFELVRDVNAAIDAGELGADDAPVVLEAFDRFDDVLGVIALRAQTRGGRPAGDPAEIERLMDERAWRAGSGISPPRIGIRDDLDARGIVLEDTPAGTRWKRK